MKNVEKLFGRTIKNITNTQSRVVFTFEDGSEFEMNHYGALNWEVVERWTHEKIMKTCESIRDAAGEAFFGGRHHFNLSQQELVEEAIRPLVDRCPVMGASYVRCSETGFHIDIHVKDHKEPYVISVASAVRPYK